METTLNTELHRMIQQTIKGNRANAFDLNTPNEILLEELGIYYRELEFQNDELRNTQSILEETKLDLLDLIESAPVGYIIYDEDYVINVTNRYFENLLNKAKSQLFGIKMTDIIAPESQDAFYIHLKKLKEYHQYESCEISFLNNYNNIPVKIETSLKYRNGKNQFLSAITNLSTQKKTERELLQSQLDIKRFANHIQEIREEERATLARDIHDDLGQILIAMKIDLGLLKNTATHSLNSVENMNLTQKFDELSGLVDKTIKSARRIMTNLRSEVLEMLGFNETIIQHLKSYEERTKIKCMFVDNLPNTTLSYQQSLSLYRIVQEALNNTAKYSKATEVQLHLTEEENFLSLVISDNGVGFDMNDPKRGDSYGLMGMKERAVLLEGKLEINSNVGAGTRIKVLLPYSNNT